MEPMMRCGHTERQQGSSSSDESVSGPGPLQRRDSLESEDKLLETLFMDKHSVQHVFDINTVRHSTSHLMAAAVLELWPEAKFGVGPSIKNGFYYDVDLPVRLSEEDLRRIEDKMRELQARGVGFERLELEIEQAIELMSKLKQSYKIELLQQLKAKGSTAVDAEEAGIQDSSAQGATSVSLYRTGDFVDLCRGPHIDQADSIKAFKLMSVSGAYWRGDEHNPQLQRIYGVAFETQAELEQHLQRLEEAKKRDHRRLGAQLKIFTFSEEVGSGLPLWLPNGTVLREELEKLAKEEERRDGYKRVSTPHLTKGTLYERSGHLPYYKDDMYAPVLIEGEEFYLKPMNCPHHHEIFLSEPRSYRDLPLRLAEYGQVYRFEQSGVLSGIMRTRGFCQNDAHIYARFDQAEEEFLRVMHLHARFYQIFGIENFFMRFSMPDMSKLSKYVNEPDEWINAMHVIRQAMEKSGYRYVDAPGEAAFYGPKIDFMIENVMGVEYAISTNQLDFMATKRFGLSYTGEDGQPHPVYVIHRAPLGSHERFIAFLIEHYGGAFPVWLAPVQAVIIPISDRHADYAQKLHEILVDAPVQTALGGVRAELDNSRESMQKRIRNAQLQKVPYMLIVGDREVAESTVSVRTRSGVDLGAMSVESFLKRLGQEVASRRDVQQ